MAKNVKTLIFCYDDFRGFAEDVKKRFGDESRYKVYSFQTREEFVNTLIEEKENKHCKIAILGAHDTTEQLEMINKLTIELKDIDPSTGIILLGPPDKMDEIKQAIIFNVEAYIPKNNNAVLRIHNIVKKLISEHNINVFRKRRNFSLYVLLAFLIVSILLVIVARFKLPQYF